MQKLWDLWFSCAEQCLREQRWLCSTRGYPAQNDGAPHESGAVGVRDASVHLRSCPCELLPEQLESSSGLLSVGRKLSWGEFMILSVFTAFGTLVKQGPVGLGGLASRAALSLSTT